MLLFAAAALAFDLQEVATVALPAPATRLVPTPRAGGLYVLVLGADTVDVREREGRSTIGTLGRGARDAAQRDADSDGVPELWLCDDDGVWRVPWPTATTFEAPVQVSTEACRSFAVIEGGLVVSGAALVQWSDDGAGGLIAAETIGGDHDPALLASDRVTAIAATEGGANVTIVDATGHDVVDTDAVGGVALVGGVPTWSLANLAAVDDEDGTRVAVAEGPKSIAAADLDGNGVDDLVVLHPDAGLLGVLRGTRAEETFAVGGWGPIVGVPGAECDAVWALDAAGTTLHVAAVTDCGEDTDADGDGYTATDGDCDDTDATTWPGAPAGCDGADHDCDGVVEWDPGDWFPAEVALLEGTTVKVVLDPVCFGDVVMTWSVPTDARIECKTYDRSIWCTGVDDVELLLAAYVATADGTLLDNRTSTYTVLNVAPEVDRADFGALARDAVSLTAGVPFAEPIPVREPGADAVTFALLTGPDGLTLDAAGNVDWTPTEDQLGGSRVEVLLTDDDGGQTTQAYMFNVVSADTGGSGCCSSSGAFLLVAALATRRRART